MSRPRKPSRAVACRIDVEAYRRLAATAARKDMKVGTYVRRWLERAFAPPARPNV